MNCATTNGIKEAQLRDGKRFANEGFTICNLNCRHEDVVRGLRVVIADILGHKNHDEGAALLLRDIWRRGVEVETMMEHTLACL